MSKEALEKAYKEIAKAECGALQTAVDALTDCSEKLEKEMEKLPASVPVPTRTTALQSIISVKAQVDNLIASLNGNLNVYNNEDAGVTAAAPVPLQPIP